MSKCHKVFLGRRNFKIINNKKTEEIEDKIIKKLLQKMIKRSIQFMVLIFKA